MKRILSLLLAAALTTALLTSPAAAASTAPWLEVDGIGTANQTISLRGLSGSYDSLQITLTLDKAPTGFAFDASLSDDATHATYSVSGSSVTLYVTSKNQLNQGDAILLGVLTASTSFNVTSASSLKLLDLDEANTRETAYSYIGVGGASTGANTGTGAGINAGSGAGTGGSGGSTGTGTGTGAIPFTDVPQTEWFYDAVSYVYSHSLMNGTGSTTFDPDGTTTRGMIVTILYRYEGSPAAGMSSFSDVAPGQYYAGPVAWAAAHGIVNGYPNGTFAPDAPITREQFAAILYRYAQYKGFDVRGRANLYAAFTDAGQVSDYARDAMAWANYEKLINGVTTTTLQPGGFATRAQAAAILMRFCENITQ